MTVRLNEGNVREAALRGARQGIVAATENVRNEVVRLILAPPKSGRIYRRRSVEHQASAPGEAPASATDRLLNSIRTSYRDGYLTGVVSASTEYAAALEFGTRKMEPRPFMRPALANQRAAIEATVAAFVRSAIAGRS